MHALGGPGSPLPAAATVSAELKLGMEEMEGVVGLENPRGEETLGLSVMDTSSSASVIFKSCASPGILHHSS